MPTLGRIAEYAKGEIPDEWAALEGSRNYGASFLARKAEAVMASLWGEILSQSDERSLDPLVAEFAGKKLALSLINPSLSYWSKQPLSIGATGTNENKSYNDRAAYLRVIRENLAADIAALWPEVQPLLPDRRYKRVVTVPTVQQAGLSGTYKTPQPDDFESPYNVTGG